MITIVNTSPPAYATCYNCLGVRVLSDHGKVTLGCRKCADTGRDAIPWPELIRGLRMGNERNEGVSGWR